MPTTERRWSSRTRRSGKLAALGLWLSLRNLGAFAESFVVVVES